MAPLIGLGETKGTPSKEIEAIKAADFLLNVDPSGGAWIKFNKAPAAEGEGGARGGRRRRRG